MSNNNEEFIGNGGILLSAPPSNPLNVDDFVSRTEVALGNRPGLKQVNKFGFNEDISKNSFIPIWSFGGIYTYQSVANTPSIVSTDANDTLTGTGARTVVVSGLDENYNEIEETVNLNGLLPVQLSNAYIRINRVFVDQAGASFINSGQITVFNNSEVYASIEPDIGQTQQALYTVPAGKTAFLAKLKTSINHSPNSTGKKDGLGGIFIKSPNSAFRSIFSYSLSMNGTSAIQLESSYPEAIPERTDIAIRFKSFSNKTLVTASFDLLLRDNQ